MKYHLVAYLNKRLTLLITLLTCLLIPFGTIYAAESKIVIVIDDIGYRKTDEQALNIPGNITYAVLPHTPYGKRLALKAHETNRDVLLHIPMESSIGKALGPGALTSDMQEQDFIHQLESAFKEIPFAVGINNHMGSKLTQLDFPMVWTMRILKNHNMMFLDSMTTTLSVGRKTADQHQVPNLRRHVFLDNVLTEESITKQFSTLISLAHKNAQKGQVAVGIAHPHPETINTLNKLIPKLSNENITLIKISTAIKFTNKQKLLAQLH